MAKQQQTSEPLAVLGTGMLLDGTHFYVVPSTSEPGRVHLVRQLVSRLSCDCKAGQYGRRCKHVAAVVAHKERLQLETALAATTQRMERIADRIGQMAAGREADYGTRSAPRESLLNRTQPFSLMAR